MQSFLGQINFVKCFVPDFSQIVMHLRDMIKKKRIYKCQQTERTYFESIKQAIIYSPSLSLPNFPE